ncbi:MAG: PAS domain S-box protein [Gammaproteobacteria bacterium]|nr:PAS domain S-box protein [Gammaproteobacteria bacterium]MCF6362988.1 PAS domain S-box protein [Gammaproteobacteria bacterium]
MSITQLQGLQAVLDEHAVVSITDVNGKITYVNDKFCDVSGYRREELLGRNHRIVKSAAHSDGFFHDMWRVIANGDTWQGMIENRTKEGASYWVQATIMPLLNEKGKPEQYISIRTDVSARIRAQKGLRHFKHILDQTLDCVFLFDSRTLRFMYVNQGAVEQVGYTESELLAMTPLDIKPEYDEARFRETMAPLTGGERDHLTLEATHVAKSGKHIPVEIFLQYFPEGPEHGQYIAIVRDISERQRINRALESLTVTAFSQHVFHDISRSVSLALGYRWAGVGRFIDGKRRVEMLGFWDTDHEAELFSYDLAGTPCAEVSRDHISLIIPDRVAERYPDDNMLRDLGAVCYRGERLRGAEGEGIGVLFTLDDKPCEESATDRALLRVAAERAALELQRMAVEKALATRNNELFEMLSRISDGFFSLTADWHFTYLNQTASTMFDTSWDEVRGKVISDVLPEVASFFFKPLHQAMNSQSLVRTEGFYPPLSRWFSVHIYPSPEGVSVYLRDITEQRNVQEERRRMDERMQQVQKMEAIGQLTAGIAHDFNNILASIMGYTDLAMTRCVGEGQEKLEEYLGQVYHAGERARDLIQQMLTFSRTGDSPAKPLDPVPLVKETLKMLTATLPASIHLKFDRLADELPKIRAEPVQLQQLIMNLCINARDAMGGKGELTVGLAFCRHSGDECSSCHESISGNYVELIVSDTGQGMDSHTLAHLFEPFFTTKEVGDGTGLGLSMVHGIMHDCHGHIRVDSAIGKGTSFRLLFEPVEGDGKWLAEDPETDVLVAGGEGQHILLVDDEKAILGFMRAWLSRAGYDIHAFADSRQALGYFQQHPEQIDLVITDQTMPALTGVELAAEMLALRSDLPVILCSGCSDQVDKEAARAAGIRRFFNKPYDRAPILATIHELLNPD